MLNNKVYFLSMRVYGRNNGKFSDAQRAIVEFSRPIEAGRPVMFQSNNTKLFGEVIDCVETETGSDLHKMLNSLNGNKVSVWVHDRSSSGIDLQPEQVL